MGLKLHQLRALVAVVRHGSVRAAAEATGFTQAALSKSLRQLEAETGVPVLARDARGLRLTAAGAGLHARAQLVVAQLDRVGEDLAEAPESTRGSVSVSLPGSVVAQGLAGPYGRFRERFPRVDLRLLQLSPGAIAAALDSGELDFAMVEDGHELEGDALRLEVLQRAPRHVVVRAGHPVLAQPSAEALAQLEWLKLASRDSLRLGRFRAAFRIAGTAPPRRIIECDELIALHLLRSTDVAAMLPQSTLAGLDCRGLERVPPTGLPLPDIELGLVRRPDVPLTPAAQFLRDALVALVVRRN